jgi:septum formation protein
MVDIVALPKLTVNLASTSLRRHQLLTQIGVDFFALAVAIDETWRRGRESANDYVTRMAMEKARAGRLMAQNTYPVLAADTSVVMDDVTLGKAESRSEARAMLGQLSGRSHEVYSAVALLHEDRELLRLSVSCVQFRALSEEEIMGYCNTDEPLGKAGGYAIQGYAARFIEGIEGSYSGVMGLPLFEVSEMLKAVYRA